MDNLVIMKNEQAVTTSLQIAVDFEKEHYDVIKSINKLKEDVGSFSEMFVEDYAPDSYGRPRKIYFMNRDGFTLLAMGYNGKKALEFKIKYINAFNQMEKIIKGPQTSMSQEDIMIATLENQKEIKRKLATVSDDVASLKNEVDLSRLQKSKLSKLVRVNAMAAVGGKKSNAYSELYRIAISEHWREIKNYFEVASYEEIPKLRFDEAMEIAAMWTPSLELAMDIKYSNNHSETEG